MLMPTDQAERAVQPRRNPSRTIDTRTDEIMPGSVRTDPTVTHDGKHETIVGHRPTTPSARPQRRQLRPEPSGRPSRSCDTEVPPTGARTLRTLLVEDDDMHAGLLQALMVDGHLEHEVRFTRARSLAEAKKQFRGREDFDVVLLDLGLPDGTGLETYHRLAGFKAGLPIVVLSADADRELAIAAVREGAQDYLVKGQVSAEALGRVLRYAVERGRVLERERATLHQERDSVERLRRLDAMKDTFLQAVSHELRTPLAAVYGYGLTLQRKHNDLSEEQRRVMTDRLVVQADRLRRLLDDLLDVNRLSAGAIEVRAEQVDLARLAVGVASRVEMPHHRLHVDAQVVPIMAEASKIERIVENLLNNAAKHTPLGTNVWLRTEATAGGALLTVENDGAAVSDDLKFVIFEAFRQGSDSQHAASPGTGIGLNLVAKFAELHHGQAWVEDRSGGGASFKVFLPTDLRTSGPDERARPREGHLPRAASRPRGNLALPRPAEYAPR